MPYNRNIRCKWRGKRFKPEEIVMKLREVELAQSKGMDILQEGKLAYQTKVITDGEKI